MNASITAKATTLPAKVSLGTGVLMIVVGVVVAEIALSASQQQLAKRASALHASVVAIGKDCELNPRVPHCADRVLIHARDGSGVDHDIALAAGSGALGLKIGDPLLIVHRAGQTDAIASDSLIQQWCVPMIFGVLGLLLIGFGIMVSMKALRRWHDRRWLLAHGQRVVAGSLEIGRIRSVSDNLRSDWPYQIVAQWRDPADGVIHCFGSDPILIDPKPSIANRSSVEVLIDPQRPDRYWMDTRFLPPVPRMFVRD